MLCSIHLAHSLLALRLQLPAPKSLNAFCGVRKSREWRNTHFFDSFIVGPKTNHPSMIKGIRPFIYSNFLLLCEMIRHLQQHIFSSPLLSFICAFFTSACALIKQKTRPKYQRYTDGYRCCSRCQTKKEECEKKKKWGEQWMHFALHIFCETWDFILFWPYFFPSR